jgi:RES domain
MNVAGCAHLLMRPEPAAPHGAFAGSTWYRAIPSAYKKYALRTGHTKTFSSRFNQAKNKRGFEILYLAENPTVARFESQARLGWPFGVSVPNPFGSWVILRATINLAAVADLVDRREQLVIATTAQELTGDWRGNHLRAAPGALAQPPSVLLPTGAAPTQALGESLFRLKLCEGCISVSAKMPTHRILVDFPRKLQPGSSLEFFDDNDKSMGTIGRKAAVP